MILLFTINLRKTHFQADCISYLYEFHVFLEGMYSYSCFSITTGSQPHSANSVRCGRFPVPRHSGAICRAWSRPAARPVYRAWVHSWRCVLRVARPGRWSSRPRTCTTPVRPTSCTSRRESRPGNYKKCYFLYKKNCNNNFYKKTA